MPQDRSSQDRSSPFGSVVAWVSAGLTIVKAFVTGRSAKKAKAEAEAAENEATWRITWRKPTITFGDLPANSITGYWLKNMTNTRKYGVSVETPAGTLTLGAIPGDGYIALEQKEETPNRLFKVSWYPMAKPKKRDRPRTHEVLPY